MLTDQQRLTAARDAYHALMTGKSPRVIVDQNGERVEFTAANATRLYNYIKQLEQAVGGSTVPQNRPAQFLF